MKTSAAGTLNSRPTWHIGGLLERPCCWQLHCLFALWRCCPVFVVLDAYVAGIGLGGWLDWIAILDYGSATEGFTGGMLTVSGVGNISCGLGCKSSGTGTTSFGLGMGFGTRNLDLKISTSFSKAACSLSARGANAETVVELCRAWMRSNAAAQADWVEDAVVMTTFEGNHATVS
jgi:hypothetical protein